MQKTSEPKSNRFECLESVHTIAFRKVETLDYQLFGTSLFFLEGDDRNLSLFSSRQKGKVLLKLLASYQDSVLPHLVRSRLVDFQGGFVHINHTEPHGHRIC